MLIKNIHINNKSYPDKKSSIQASEVSTTLAATASIKERKNKSKNTSNTITNSEDAIYIDRKNTVSRVDGKPISDEEIPYLIEQSLKKAQKREAELKKVNPAYQRTEREENLSVNFMMKNEDLISSLEDKFSNAHRIALHEKDLNKKIEKLEDAAEVFLETRDLFYSMGKGSEIYFQDMWEYMHNSNSDCFSYLDIINEEIEKARYERDVVIPDILNTIRNNDGILQKDLYNLLPHIPKGHIKYQVTEFANNSVITKNKKGNSYELHIVTPEDKV